MSESTSGFAVVDGGRLYYEGAGPAVVLLHAGVADSRMWDAQFTAFAPHYRVVRYDARGFGRSQTEAVSFSNRDDLLALMRHLGIEQAVLVGNSRGGQIALNFALEFPQHVSALVLIAPGLGSFDYEPIEAAAGLAPTFETMEQLEEAQEWERLADMEIQIWTNGPGQAPVRTPAVLRALMRQMILDTYTKQTVKTQARPLEPPAVGRLGEVQAPTLVLVGDLDVISCIAIADALEVGIAGARKIVFPQTAHMLSTEQPEQFNRVVLEFLQQKMVG